MTSTPPAGWYNDPSGAVGTLRYWDGAIWTGHTHTVAAPSPAPPLWQGPPLVNYGRRLHSWNISIGWKGILIDAALAIA